MRATAPDLADPNWYLEGTLSDDDLATVEKVRVKLELLNAYTSTPRSPEERMFLVCSEDAYKPLRTLGLVVVAKAKTLTAEQQALQARSTSLVTMLTAMPNHNVGSQHQPCAPDQRTQ